MRVAAFVLLETFERVLPIFKTRNREHILRFRRFHIPQSVCFSTRVTEGSFFGSIPLEPGKPLKPGRNESSTAFVLGEDGVQWLFWITSKFAWLCLLARRTMETLLRLDSHDRCCWDGWRSLVRSATGCCGWRGRGRLLFTSTAEKKDNKSAYMSQKYECSSIARSLPIGNSKELQHWGLLGHDCATMNTVSR